MAERIHLHTKGLDDNLTTLENSTSVYTIQETDDNQGTFTANADGKGTGKDHQLPGGTIKWNSSFALGTTNGTVLSPESILNHEADHGADYDKDPNGHYDRSHTPDAKYGNAEEKRVITGSEQKTSLALGEIKLGQVTRTDHAGNSAYFTTSPLTNKGTSVPLSIFRLQEIKIVAPRPKVVNPKKDQ